MKTLVFGLLALSLILSGCIIGGQQQNVTNETPAPPPVVVKAPSFTVTSPADGSTIMISADNSDVTLQFSTQNLILKQAGGAAKKGEGHFKITLDGSATFTAATKAYILSNLSAGQHTIRIELINNDNKPYSPEISKEITFTTEMEAPAEYIPQQYTVTVKDFSYDPADLTVKVGDTVTFVNTGSFPRSATSFIGGIEKFNTGVLGPGQNATIAFNDVGTFPFYAVTQPTVKGTITVESNGTG